MEPHGAFTTNVYKCWNHMTLVDDDESISHVCKDCAESESQSLCCGTALLLRCFDSCFFFSFSGLIQPLERCIIEGLDASS